MLRKKSSNEWIWTTDQGLMTGCKRTVIILTVQAEEVISKMVKSYTAKYTKIQSGYMGQLVEWPEVITEGKTLEECREMLKDALKEMLLAYKQQGKEIPLGGGLLEQILVEA
jgi:predicted RNase H-like HicB family nuclease